MASLVQCIVLAASGTARYASADGPCVVVVVVLALADTVASVVGAWSRGILVVLLRDLASCMSTLHPATRRRHCVGDGMSRFESTRDCQVDDCFGQTCVGM